MTPRVDPSGGPFTERCPECGWVSKPARTEGLARHALAKHSCERQRQLAARSERATTRYDHIDRTPKPCPHKAKHAHGTRVAYVFDKCRCLPCSKATREYEARRQRAHLYGRFDRLVDAQETREHVRELMAQGMGRRRIADVAGVQPSVLTRLLYGRPATAPSERIRPQTANALLGVELDLAAHATLEAFGTLRRLQALVAAGWTQTELARRLGMTNANLGTLIHSRDRVLRQTADKVAALYEEISECAPPATGVPYATKVAERNGWAPPICWDEDTLDDPMAEPNWTGFDETLVQDWLANYRAPTGAGPEELVEVNRRLMAWEFTVRQTAVITGLPAAEVRAMRNHITRQDRDNGVWRRVYKGWGAEAAWSFPREDTG